MKQTELLEKTIRFFEKELETVEDALFIAPEQKRTEWEEEKRMYLCALQVMRREIQSRKAEHAGREC